MDPKVTRVFQQYAPFNPQIDPKIHMPSRRRRSLSPSDDAEVRKVLPARSSRGSRIHKLIGAEFEADASFWGQSAWQEDGEDEDYSTEAGMFVLNGILSQITTFSY